MTNCCGPDFCAPSVSEYTCQALKLLPDFSGKLDPEGDYIKFIKAIIEAYYECVVQSACEISKEFSPCESELYFDRWIEEYGLPFRCPVDVDAVLLAELQRLQLCLQLQLSSGSVFNQDLLNQIADVLDISYEVKVPTYDLEGVPVCDIIPMPPSAVSRCRPDGCYFQQAYYICITCAPTKAHISIFECFIEQLNPCHVIYCVLDETPSIEIEDCGCDEEVLADCEDLSISVEDCAGCEEEVPADV